jgi:omega-6 fatty acid desaturase (delta-12 desaturase)
MNQSELLKKLHTYAVPVTRRSVLQAIVTLGIFATSILLMILLLQHGASPWLVVLISLLTAPIFVRLFIIFHDCCHTSFFKSQRACSLLGHLLGVITLTSYSDWQRTHGIHHGSVANLDKRGMGDVWLMTVAEYNRATSWERLCYRLYRHPLVLFFVSPPFLFFILNRLPSKGFRRKDLLSVLLTDLLIALMVLLFCLTIGWREYLLIMLPMMSAASLMGVWLFYVQHQFRTVYWAHSSDWDRFRAAMDGCSLYMMPAVLRWFTGNIGFHHIHHLAPRIPNYRLKECYDAIPELQQIRPIPFLAGLSNIFLSLWDEGSATLVSFGEARRSPTAS